MSVADLRRLIQRATPRVEDVRSPDRTDIIRRNHGHLALLEIVDAAGFQKDYDVVSLPVDLKTEELLGFAFINFTTHEQAEKFKAQFNGFSDWQVPCDNVCEVKWSDNLHGCDAHVERYRNSPVMHESVADRFKPALYKNGVRVPFPAPTKPIKAPRARTRVRGGGHKVSTEASKSGDAEELEDAETV